jgi:uncharacterized protein YbjQ (UPF0145 family)
MGFLNDIKEALNSQREKAAAEEQEQLARQRAIDELDRQASTVLVTTGDLHQDYEILGPIFAIGGDDAPSGKVLAAHLASQIGLKDYSGKGSLQGNPLRAFEVANLLLRRQCVTAGGNAVVSTRYEHRVAIGNSSGSTASQAIEFWAYGTAVKLR